jgi:hypothetical protein
VTRRPTKATRGRGNRLDPDAAPVVLYVRITEAQAAKLDAIAQAKGAERASVVRWMIDKATV